jgi:hypothetical protein
MDNGTYKPTPPLLACCWRSLKLEIRLIGGWGLGVILCSEMGEHAYLEVLLARVSIDLEF